MRQRRCRRTPGTSSGRWGWGGVAMLAVGVGLRALAGQAAARPTVAPVTLVVKATPEPQPLCDACLHLTGRVKSPKAVCRRKRVLAGAFRYRAGTEYAGTTYREERFTWTDGQGRIDHLAVSVEPLAWIRLTVPKQRIGRVLCKAAQAKVTL